MKKIYLIFILLPLLFMALSCDSDLPYPIDDVKRGVLIDITRIAGTDGLLSDGITAGDYKIKVLIPENQGDYSFLKEVQLLAILQIPGEKTKTAVVMENITEFPREIPLDMADVYAKLGLTAPTLGETLIFTANVILDNGDVIPGWTELTGFNNRAFSGWRVEGRAYSYNVRYPVVCELVLEDFVGDCTVTLDEWWGETPYEVQVTKVSDTELSIAGLFNGEASNPLVISISPEDHSVSFDKQVLKPNSDVWWGNPSYTNFALGGGSGSVNACETKISFEATATVDAGSFGAAKFELGK